MTTQQVVDYFLKHGYMPPENKIIVDARTYMTPDTIRPKGDGQIEISKNGDVGLRYNDGKLRYDLIHPVAERGLVRVLTKGSIKYEPKNWEKGMPWSTVIASLRRHMAAFMMGEDYDPESGELHVDHIQCNAHFLSAYYKIAPKYDDRDRPYMRGLKIGLDIDEVLCDWTKGWCDKFGLPYPVKNWNFNYNNGELFKTLSEQEMKETYLDLPAKMDPATLPFEPHCYITSRSVPVELTQAWLQHKGFPTSKVYSVGFGESKVAAAKESGIDVFVDDSFNNFVELNKAGILTYLWDAPHNQKYDVGYRRIKSLKELVF